MLDSKIMKENKVIVYNLWRCLKILVPGDNGNENPKESYARKYQKHIACSYGYNLVCVWMVNVVSLLKQTLLKMQFTILLIV